ncbi:coiled-coil domain-containing protein 187 isoform X2 [Oryctolagus cuniculus]|uniref:coiled-coil domain-containing protein 187 isoform X2 n=1 Tax=Oryctolagus cuniculus TaxID=9986 RepID=UPI00387A8277
MLPVCLRETLQPYPSRGQGWCLLPYRALGAAAAATAREDRLRPPVAKDDLSALRWPGPCRQPRVLQVAAPAAWADLGEEPEPQGCSLPMWSSGQDARDGDSSVSSGRLSGSSGGHEACAPPRGTWKERPPQVLGPRRPPRRSDPRLEQLRDRIRAQAQWQGSCASLGTSALSSASSRVLRRKTRKLTDTLPAPAHPAPREKTKRIRGCSSERETAPGPPVPGRAAKGRDSESVSVHAWRRGQALARALLGPPPAQPRLQNTDGGPKSADSGRSRSPAPARSQQQVAEKAAGQASCDQPAMIQTAMATLRALRQQIQAGLELAQGPSGGRKPKPKPKPKPESEARAEMGRHGPWSAPAAHDSSTMYPRASPGRAGSVHCWPPQRASAARERWPQGAWAARGREPCFQRPWSPPEKPSPCSQRPWSASAGQTRPSWARAASEACGTPGPSPWSPPERPRPATPRPWSSSSVFRAGTACKDRASGRPAAGARQAWLGPARSVGTDARPPSPCPRPRGPLGQPHSSASLRDFMRQKAVARRQQALQEKASAARALELRSQRLQEVYRKQKEAVLGRAVPVVSQTTPGIVTFVPSSAQCGGVEAPESLGSPVPAWSKVTSGVVLGDQEAPGSFCLCLNRAWSRAEPPETSRRQDGWEGAPLLLPTTSSLGLRLQDLPRGLCVYLDPQEAKRLGTAGPLHWEHKQARLQALETMAHVLRQRIDILTSKLHRPEAPDAAPPPRPSTLPAAAASPAASPATACPGALVPDGGRGVPRHWVDVQARPLLSPTYFLDAEMLPWGPGTCRESRSPGVEGGRRELERKLRRELASIQALGTLAGSSRGAPATPDPTCDSLWLEETPAAGGAGWAEPWSCGQRQPRDPQAGHLADIQRKSWRFLEALELGQQAQEQALALLRQRAEQEVWETQTALDGLLFKHRLQRAMDKRPGQAEQDAASQLERPQALEDAGQTRGSPCAAPAGPHSHPPPAGGAAEASPGEEPSAPARTQPPDDPACQRAPPRPRPAEPAAPRARGRLTAQMLEQSLREERLRAQHQAALLRLREMALEETTRAELAWLEHQRGRLRSQGDRAAWAALAERQQRALSSLDKGKREIRHLRDIQLSMHRDRTLLLQHQKDVLCVQRAAALLWQELQAPSCSPRFQAARQRGSGQTPQPEGTPCPMETPWPRGPSSPRPWRPRDSTEALQPATEPPHTTPAQAASGPRWGEGVPAASSPLAESDYQAGPGLGTPRGPVQASDIWACAAEPREQLRAAPPAVRHLSLLDMRQQPLGPALAATPGSPTPAQPWLPEAGEPPPGDPQSKPSPALAEEPRAWGCHTESSLDRSRNSRDGGGVCVAEGSTSRPEAELALELARSPVQEPQAAESVRSGEQRMEARQPEDPSAPFSRLGAPLLAAPPAPANLDEEGVPAAQCPGSPLPQPAAPRGLSPASACGTYSEVQGSSPASWASSASGGPGPSPTRFQKAKAILVQLSDSSASPSSVGAQDDPPTGWGWGLSTRSSWEALGPPPSSVPGGTGGLSWQGPQAWAAGALGGLSVEAAGAGASELGHSPPPPPSPPSPPSGSWSLPLPDAPWAGAGAGSELSEASSHVWDEHSEEHLPGPGTGAGPAPGSLSPADSSADLLGDRVAPQLHPSLGPRDGREAPRSGESPTTGSDTGRATRASPEAADGAVTAHPSSSGDSDLSLSFPSEGVGFGGGETAPLQAWPAPQVPPSPQAPPGGPGGLARGGGRDRRPSVLEEAGAPRAPRAGGILAEILSPVDEQLSYGSADLPSCPAWDTRLPPPPPARPADSDVEGAAPGRKDSPSPPEEASLPGDSADTTDQLSTLSEELLEAGPRAASPELA